MRQTSRGNLVWLFLGDMVIFSGALVLTLALRYQEWPSKDIVAQHIVPFTALFVLWVLVFLIAGLYDANISLTRKKIPELVIKAQIANMLLAAMFFFLLPVGIAPKTTLLLYLIVSTVLIGVWRLFIFPQVLTSKPALALIVGSGDEVMELAKALNENPYFRFVCADVVDTSVHTDESVLQTELLNYIQERDVEIIVGDTRDRHAVNLVPLYYNLTFLHRHVSFISVHQLYEQIFYRVPLTLIEERWLLDNISRTPHYVYDALKRIVDVLGAVVLGAISLAVYPFIIVAIKWDDGGPIFYQTTRIGQFNQPIRIVKFRTMTGFDSGIDALESKHVVTRVGAILRRFRLDEIPQLFNIFTGALSFVGPRPEMPALANVYAEKIQYYNMRHLIKPGLSGWAQIYHEAHPHHGTDTVETKNKLSYDLYYLKRRSFLLDLEIALKTIKILLSRSGI